MERGRCKTCRREIAWVKFRDGKAMPLDPEPSATGNVYRGTDGRWRVATKADAQQLASTLTPLYAAHFVTCPQADQHRRHAAKRQPKLKQVEVVQLQLGVTRTVTAEVVSNRRELTRGRK